MNTHRVIRTSAVCALTMLVAIFLSAIGRLAANTVTTPCGTNVPHLHPLDWETEWTDTEKAQKDADILASFDDVTVDPNSATKSYNCHSYAWAGGPDGGAEWINDPAPYIDSYYVDFANGHKLTYLHCVTNSPSHSANDHEPFDYKATSKWGASSVVTHAWDNVPTSYGSVTGIYSPVPACKCDPNADCGS